MPRDNEFRGSSMWRQLTHKERIIGRFLIELMGLDENNAKDVKEVIFIIKTVGVN